MRRTVTRDSSGTVHSVSNAETRIASNMTRIFARMLVDITVAYGTDIDRATTIANEVGEAMLKDDAWAGRLLEAPKLLPVLTGSSIVFAAVMILGASLVSVLVPAWIAVRVSPLRAMQAED